MVRGLITKTIREASLTTLVFALALGALEGLFAYVFPTFLGELGEQWLQVSFVQNMFRALLGTAADNLLGPGVVGSIAWVHPVALTLVWAQAIVLCTRVPAGEVDRGTIDVLLGLPVSRTGVYLCETVVWLAAGVVLIAMGLAGQLVGRCFVASELAAPAGALFAILANLYCLYVAVCGIACLVSSLSSRRGRAVGVVFGIVLASFFLSFLAQFWEPVSQVSFLTVLNYYRPLLILRDGHWPLSDMLVLACVGAAAWTAGAIVFARRDIRTD